MVLCAGLVGSLPAAEAKADLSLEHGLELFHAGAYNQAIPILTKVVEQCAAKRDQPGQVSAMLALSATYQTLGQYCSATDCLEQARLIAQIANSAKLQMRVQAALGNVYMFSRRFDKAEDLLRESLKRARQLDDSAALAGILQNLASLLVAKDPQPRREYQKNARGFIETVEPEAPKQIAYEEGLRCYAEGLERARALGDKALLLRILINKTRALMRHGDCLAAKTACEEVRRQLSGPLDLSEKAFLWVSCGRLFAELAECIGDGGGNLKSKALEAYQEAIRLAEPSHDLRTATYAHGYWGELFRQEGRLDDAMALTQRAMFLAQKSNLDEARFLWEWQAARILRDQAQLGEAIKAAMGGKQLLDERFQMTPFEREMTDSRLSVVHLASHGEFGSDASKTFILAYDGKLTMDRLEQLILPHMLSDQPIELLALSACRTAAGDERAALGLAGLAVKSGARSALATLWYVNDEASQRVMSGFYANLKQDSSLSKARALQRAQCALLADERFHHPCFWAPYLIIGNWL